MVQDRHTVVFYTSAVCNLNCRYCAIDKNPALVEIDRKLEESFQGDYYFDFCREVFPDPKQLRRFETWGGEPFLGMDRLHHTLRRLFEFYPNLCEGFSSSNLISEHFHDQFYRLMAVLGESGRPFKYYLQLSLDGPEWVNDRNRGKGTTARIRESLHRLFREIDSHLPDNVSVEMAFKPTLDMQTIRELDTLEKIIEYYRFFEEFYRDFGSVSHNGRVSMRKTKPNTACPMPHTSEDGRVFAELVRMCREIERQNANHEIFEFYEQDITPYASRDVHCLNGCGGTCGTCKYICGLLPDRMISGCHSAFVNVLAKYKACVHSHTHDAKVLDVNMYLRDPNDFLCFHAEQLATREAQIERYYAPGTTARLQASATLIQLLAYSGQVDKKYRDVNEATKAANYIGTACAGCINDNRAVTGTITLPQVGILRLLLNGADKYLI